MSQNEPSSKTTLTVSIWQKIVENNPFLMRPTFRCTLLQNYRVGQLLYNKAGLPLYILKWDYIKSLHRQGIGLYLK